MKLRILLVEDDLALRDYLANSLMDRGFEIMRVSRPSQALTLLEMAAIELAIIDGALPEMDGLSLLRQARAQGYRGKCIFISATPERFFPAQDEQASQVMDALGIAQIAKKPLSFDALADDIEELMHEELLELRQFASDDDLTALQPLPPEAQGLSLVDASNEISRLAADDDMVFTTTPVIDTTPSDSYVDLEALLSFDEDLDAPNTIVAPQPGSTDEAFSAEEIEEVLVSLIQTEPPQQQPAIATPNAMDAMDAMDASGLQATLAQLQRDHCKTLEARIYSLLHLLAPIRHRQDQEALQQAIEVSHKLHGASGTFGFEEISLLAGWLEGTFASLQQRGTLSPPCWEKIFSQVERALIIQQEFATTNAIAPAQPS